MRLGLQLEGEGRVRREVRGGRLRVRVHWDPSLEGVEEAVGEAVTYWEDRLKVQKKIAFSFIIKKQHKKCCVGAAAGGPHPAGQELRGPGGVVGQGLPWGQGLCRDY